MDIKAIINNYIATVTKKYFCFEGRTGRKAFWTFILVNFVVNFVLSLIPGVGKILAGLWGLAVLCPTLGITARRLHDTGKTGWLQLILVIPVIGAIALLIICAKAGDGASNKYGDAVAE